MNDTPYFAPLASRKARLASFALDSLLYLLIWVPFLAMGLEVMVSGFRADAKTLPGMILGLTWGGLVATVLLTIYQWRLAMNGLSIGNRAFRIRVIRAQTGEPPGFWRGVVLRRFGFYLLGSGLWGAVFAWKGAEDSLASVLVDLVLLVDVLWILGPRRRCLHDWLAGTAVVTTDLAALLAAEPSDGYAPSAVG